MPKLCLLLCALVLLLAPAAEGQGTIDCYGEYGDLEGTDRNRVDRWLNWIMRNKNKHNWRGWLIKRFYREGKDPDSILRRILGKFGQDTRSTYFDEREPFANVDFRWKTVLDDIVGGGRTVISFLWNYGYLPKIMEMSKKSAEEFNGVISPCALTNAVMEFQRFNQITPVNGILTKETRALMAQDRCGNADVKCETAECLAEDEVDEEDENVDDGHLKRKKRYSVKTKLWRPSATDGEIHLNFWYENMYNPNDDGKTGHAQMTEAQVRYEVEKGMAEWAKHTGVHLNEVLSKDDADIKLYFGQDAHNEKKTSAYFDGQMGVLAHMYYPRSGKMHFDQAENFTASHQGPGINLYTVAAHEMGHGLGIEHSKVRGALMYPYYTGYQEEMLAEDDISAIQSLYGSGTGSLTHIYDYSELERQELDEDGETDNFVATEAPAWLTTADSTTTQGSTTTEGQESTTAKQQEEPHEDEMADNFNENVEEEEERPIYCVSAPFDAGFADPLDDVVYLFKDDRYYRLVKRQPGSAPSYPILEEGSTYQLLISEGFSGLQGPYDAAVTDVNGRVTYFFRDHKVTTWDWEAGTVGQYNKEPVENTIFAGLPSPITAVARYRDYFLFFTAEDKYFIFSMRDGRLNDEAYVSPLSKDDDLPPDVAFHSFFNGVMYTMYGDVYTVVQSRKLAAGARDYEEASESAIEGWGNLDVESEFGFTGKIEFCGRRA